MDKKTGHFRQPPSAPATTQADAKEVQSLYSETIGRNGQKTGHFGQPPSAPAATQVDGRDVQSLCSETIGRNEEN
jgi:hypothetical protein